MQEEVLIKFLRERWKNQVYGAVPSERPECFITVERAGGQIGRFLSSPRFTIQCWAKNRFEAAKLGTQICKHLQELPDAIAEIASARVIGFSNWPDQERRQARYQIVLETTSYLI